MFDSFSISDYIQLIGAVLTFLAVISSIIIAIFTLRQNSKMIEAQAKPYLVFYGTVANFQGLKYYLVLKNFGKSGAAITGFHTDIPFHTECMNKQITPFKFVEGTFLAPNQKIIYPIAAYKAFECLRPFTATVEYTWLGRRYSEQNIIDLSVFKDIPNERANTEGKELKIISYTLQDMAEKML